MRSPDGTVLEEVLTLQELVENNVETELLHFQNNVRMMLLQLQMMDVQTIAN